MDMDWSSAAAGTSSTQRSTTQYHHHHPHGALSASDTVHAIDLQNFDESANVDLQQLFPSAALGATSSSGGGGGGGATAATVAGDNFHHQHLHAPQFPHPTLYFYAPTPAQPATTPEYFGEAFPTFHTEALQPTWSSDTTGLPSIGASAGYSDHGSDSSGGGGRSGAVPTINVGGGIGVSGSFLMTTTASPKFSTDRRKLCCVEGCKSQARAFNRCKRHGGSKRCSHQGCTKSVQSRGLCIRHGGGSRCQESGCTRAAQSHGRCKMHGGGRPCIVADCEKKAHLKRLCRKHGGGAKCSQPGCEKWAQRQGMCMTHSKHGGFIGAGVTGSASGGGRGGGALSDFAAQ